MVNYQALIDRQTELNEEISVLRPLKQDAAQKIVKRLQAELLEVEQTITKNQKAIDLQKLSTNPKLQAFTNDLLGIMKSEGIDYNVRVYFDFNFATGTISPTLKPATIRGSKDSEIVYNGEAMPDKLIVTLATDKPAKEYKRATKLEHSDSFATWENLHKAFIACYGNLAQDYALYNAEFKQAQGKPSRFDAASAKEKLARMTKNAVKLDSFATVKPKKGKTGHATEQASKALG